MGSSQRKSDNRKKATYVRRSEAESEEHAAIMLKRRLKTLKSKSWSTERWQLQQMDINDLRQYIAESDDH